MLSDLMQLVATILDSTMLGGVEIYGVGQGHLRCLGYRCWCGGGTRKCRL